MWDPVGALDDADKWILGVKTAFKFIDWVEELDPSVLLVGDTSPTTSAEGLEHLAVSSEGKAGMWRFTLITLKHLEVGRGRGGPGGQGWR